jgi:hypothetical protein
MLTYYIGVGTAGLGLVVVYVHYFACACILRMSRGLECTVCTSVLCMFLEVLETFRYT